MSGRNSGRRWGCLGRRRRRGGGPEMERGEGGQAVDHVEVCWKVASGRNTAGLEQGDIVLLKCFSPNKF